jgi:enamine deaminase RidA (YjgF/YER057c/UK114 family)
MTHTNRREALGQLVRGGIAVAAAGTIRPEWAFAQAPVKAPVVPAGRRAPLGNGFVVNAGATSMELYHEHPHLPKEEIVQPEDIGLQTRLVMRNHKEILDWIGLGWGHVAKLTCYQKKMSETAKIRDVLASYFQDSTPAITSVEINGLSSPQARLEIDMWVIPTAPLKVTRTANVDGVEEIFPRPEMRSRVGYALGVKIDRRMDLLFFSSITPYPFEVDPWNPGEFKLPAEPAAQSKLATESLDAIMNVAGITPQHFMLGAGYTAQQGGGPSFGARSGNWRSPGTALQVVDTGVPGVRGLRQITAVAPHKAGAWNGPVPGIEPVLAPGMTLKNMPAAPAVRVSSSASLVFFPGITIYPDGVDPWNPAGFAPPEDIETQEKMVLERIDAMLRASGLTWKNVVLIGRVGEAPAGTQLRQRLGDWRPCLVSRVVGTGTPGAKVMYEITAAVA